DHTIAGAAVVLLSLLTGEHQSTSEAARSTALVRLLLGAPARAVGALLGTDTWTVVHAHGDRTPLSTSALAAALGTALVDPDEDPVRLLVPADREITPVEGWTLGASAPVPVAGLAAADAQAARALRRAEATRVPLIRQHANGVADLIAPEEADAHARVLLSPLSDNETLLSTLRTWLSLHGSWDRTAVALGIHRNTVRQRITRCTTLLGADLNDPDIRMELWFALTRTTT
ncbi:helix-turn-helix domain-containing protein, partial [Streptomyces sp. SID339]